MYVETAVSESCTLAPLCKAHKVVETDVFQSYMNVYYTGTCRKVFIHARASRCSQQTSLALTPITVDCKSTAPGVARKVAQQRC